MADNPAAILDPMALWVTATDLLMRVSTLAPTLKTKYTYEKVQHY